MESFSLPQPNQVEVFTVIVLEHAERYLLLQRSPHKQFAPNLWTGIGGHVENNEYDNLRKSALRELKEEAGIEEAELTTFLLRRVLFLQRPGKPLTLILYFTGLLNAWQLPECPEGTLDWCSAEKTATLPIIETTRPVLHLLIADLVRDPKGQEPVRLGLGAFAVDGTFHGIHWHDPSAY